MPAPATTTELLDALSRSGLLAPPLFDAYALRLGRASPAPDPAAALRVLLDDRAVTPFQARYLSDGRYKGFFLGGKYKLLAHLGSGGVGEVYLGEQLPLHRLVAIKLLKLSPNAGDTAGATQRFFREARAVAALSHPNIAQLYDVNHAGPTPYMVMEYVDGTNLHAVVTDHRPLSVARAVNYAVQAARGLDHAHENGLVHRDVKPGNLVLDRTGVVRLLDLGLARYHTDAAKNENLTAKYDNNNLIGTADFMAPEQTRDSSAVDARADVYSLGCTLYFLLTGRAPFHGGSVAQKLLWHQVKSPPPADALRPDVPRELAAVLDRMMAKDRDRRVQTAAEVGRALAPWFAATIDPPPAGEMPGQKSEHYRLGLVDAAPTPEPVTRLPASGAAQPASDTLVAIPPTSTAEAVGPPTAAESPRRSARRTVIFVAVQLALVAATVAGTTYLNSLSNRGLVTDAVRKSPDPDGKLVPRETLQIGGSPLAEPLVRAWATAYQRATGTGVQFAAVGSAAGVGGLLANAYDIAWTDAPTGLGSAARAGPAGKTLTRIPLAVTAVVPAYNVPGVGPGLRLSGPVLADIALGTVATWDDPRVRELNPGVPLPARPIRFVARSDRGGATAAWTDFLSDASPAWTRGPGRADTLAGWKVGTLVAGNDEVTRAVAQTEGAVGYVEWSAVPPTGVNVALVQNRAGWFAAASPQTIRAAGDGGGPDAYPVVGHAWAEFDAGMEDKGRLVLALDFLAWCLADGQTLAAELDFVPLPAASVAAAEQTLKKSRASLPNP